MTYAQHGIHEFSTHPAPDDWLKALNPQVIVTVGSAEHADAIRRTQDRAAHLHALLPNAVVAMRIWYDDNILERMTPERYAETHFILAVPGTILMVGNEDAADPKDPEVYRRTVEAHTMVVRLANSAGIPLGVCCTPMGKPEYGQYDLLAPLFQAMQDGRERGVIHWWRPNAYFPHNGNAQEIYDLAQRHQREGRKAAAKAGVQFPPMFLGEYNTVRSLADTGTGAIGMGLPALSWASALMKADVDVPTCIYCIGDGLYDQKWQQFNVARDPEYMSVMVSVLPRKDKTAFEEWKETQVAQIVNMQDHVCPIDGALYHLNSGETMQCGYDASGYGRQYKNALWEEMWVKTIGGVQYLMRGMDVSQYPAASGGKVYGLFTDNTLAEYGTPWCPVSFEVGKVYRRRVWVQWFNAQTGAKIAQGSGWDETYFKIVKYHDTWTTFEGVQVTGVAECVYGHMPDLSNVKERYYYGKRRGLVGFIDYNFNPPKQTVITREQPTSRPAPVNLSWWTRPPLEQPTVPTYPDPTTLGDPVNGVITATRANVANVRAAPAVSGKFLTTVKTGDTVVYRPTTFANEGYTWTWLVSHSGWVSNVATIGAPPKPVEPLLVDLPAPYVSQTNTDADKYNNDCMIAVLLMLTRTWFVRKGLRAPLVPTVDDLAPYTPLPVKDPQKLGLNFTDIAALGLLTGFEVEYVRPLTPDRIVRYLDEGKVVGALVTENKVNPNGKAIAHAVAVKGYGETTFSLHDPNNTEDYRIDRAQLETAMKGVPGNLFDAQGFVLKAA